MADRADLPDGPIEEGAYYTDGEGFWVFHDGHWEEMVDPPVMTPIAASSNIKAAAHDGVALWLAFTNDTVYRYPTVPADVYPLLISAPSAGKFFNLNIRAYHKGERVLCRKPQPAASSPSTT